MQCNTFYEDQCCTSCFESEGTKILNAPRMIMFKFYVNIILQLENRSKSAPTGTTDATGSIAHALKSLLIEERASSQEFLRTVNTWQRSPELQEVRQMVPNNEETLRQQWYQHRFKRFSPSKQKRSSVAERLQRRKERLRTNSDQTTG